MHTVTSGADHLPLQLLKGRRVGLMTNPTGIDHTFRSTIDLLSASCQLTALFAVEHGIRGDVQAGGTVEDTVDSVTGIPVFSAFGSHSHFSQDMLDAFDVLVFDIQDVGARFYTYIYSMAYAMESCASAGKSVVILDRINPLGGLVRSGTVLEDGFSSFVGDYALPTRYGLTEGELALYIRDRLHLALDLTIVPLEGWERSMLLPDTDLPWVPTSPNCTDFTTAMCYIGTCVFEGTNISEGRGTTLPFQVIGAPFLDAIRLANTMNAMEFPGIHFRPCSFTPSFSKHKGQLCHGVQMHLLRPDIDTFLAGLCLLDAVREQAGEQFAFISSEHGPFFLDLLLGSDRYRRGMNAREIEAFYRPQVDAFSEKIQPYLLYR